MSWRVSERLLPMIVCAMLCAGPGTAASPPDAMTATPAQVDSLVWDIEGLEADLKLCEIRGAARADSLSLRLEFMGQRLQWALDDQPRWYEKPTMAFMAGAILAMIVFGQIVKITL